MCGYCRRCVELPYVRHCKPEKGLKNEYYNFFNTRRYATINEDYFIKENVYKKLQNKISLE